MRGACGLKQKEQGTKMKILCDKIDVNWFWSWVGFYGGSLTVLAAYLISALAATTAELVSSPK